VSFRAFWASKLTWKSLYYNQKILFCPVIGGGGAGPPLSTPVHNDSWEGIQRHIFMLRERQRAFSSPNGSISKEEDESSSSGWSSSGDAFPMSREWLEGHWFVHWLVEPFYTVHKTGQRQAVAVNRGWPRVSHPQFENTGDGMWSRCDSASTAVSYHSPYAAPLYCFAPSALTMGKRLTLDEKKCGKATLTIPGVSIVRQSVRKSCISWDSSERIWNLASRTQCLQRQRFCTQWRSQEIFPGGEQIQGVWGTEVPQWGPGAKPPDADDFTMKKWGLMIPR